MSGSVKAWAARERIRLAEQEQYGDGQARYDSAAQRFRNVKAIEDPDYNITEKTLPADRPIARILQTLEEALGSDDNGAIKRAADELESIVMSYPAQEWHRVYLSVIAAILSAAKGVDGDAVSESLAQLVSALACRKDLENTTGNDLNYEIGEFWVRSVVIRPEAPLTGESGLKIWSQMPSFQLSIDEALQKHPQIGKWPDHSWQNFTRFCDKLSRLHVEGQSPVSSLLAETVRRVLLLGVERPKNTRNHRILAAVYMDLFGQEIYKLCEGKVYARYEGAAERSGPAPVGEETYSIERWNVWFEGFKSRSESGNEDERVWAAKAFESMMEVKSIALA